MDPIEPAGPSQDHPLRPPLQTRRSSAENSLSQWPTSSQQHIRPRAGSVNCSSIRLQRLPSTGALPTLEQNTPSLETRNLGNNGPLASFSNTAVSPIEEQQSETSGFEGGRRRSNSEPRPGRWSAPTPAALPRLQSGEPMHTVMEELNTQTSIGARRPVSEVHRPSIMPTQAQPRRNFVRRTSEAAMNRISRNRASTVAGTTPVPGTDVREYDSHVVDVLDVIDPEVSALTTLTNVQNSLFVPNLGSLLTRNQTYTLSPPPEMDKDESTSTEDENEAKDDAKGLEDRPRLERPITNVSAVLDEGEPRFAILPDGQTLQGWTHEEVEQLNDHVRHMLHSRRSKFKRSIKGFRKYVSKPLGFFITLYATLITLFGLAWVLFLIGWINVGGRQLEIINYIDYVLVALFAIMGDGLAPFRAVDTYHMIFIARYTFLTWKIREKRHLPNLKDKNDLPEGCPTQVDLEAAQPPHKEKEEENNDDDYEFSVLTRLQQQKLQHHQNKFAKSHTFYKPHETFTHHAFPLRLLIVIVVLLDFHSLFQIALGACTWGIDHNDRPFALTTVILCCSLTCNITGGILISVGDHRTRKKEIVERLFRQQLTREAMKKIERKKKKKEEEEGERLATGEHAGSVSDSSSTMPQPYQGT
ncbi:integral membrane protein [Aspergillus heterothallicus]